MPVPALLFAASLVLAAGVPPHDPEARIAELTAQLRAQPARIDLRLERADLLLQSDPLAALHDFECAIAAAPDCRPAARGCALALVACGREAEAVPRFRTLRAAGMADATFRLAFGRALLASGRPAEAAVELAASLPGLPVRRPEHFLELAAALQARATADDRRAALAVLERGLTELGPAVALVEAAVDLDLQLHAFERAWSRYTPLVSRSSRGEHWWRQRQRIVAAAGRPLLVVDLVAGAGSGSPAGPALPLPPHAATSVLVPRGSTWRYRDTGVPPAASWVDPGFGDTSWASGPAQLGYGDGDERTVIGYGGNAARRHVTTWFRHTFAVADPGQFHGLQLRLLRDDGATVWLNGVPVVASNVPPGLLTPDTTALTAVGGGEERAFSGFAIDRELLQAGTNVLAVELKQSAQDSSDLSFDLELVGSTAAVGVTRGPWLQSATPTSMIVRWRTDVPAPTQVWLGPQPGQLVSAYFDATPTQEHVAPLTALQPETPYVYAIGDPAAVLAGDDAQHAFTTPPLAGTSRPLRAWVLGDSGTAGLGASLVRDAYGQFAATRPADLMLMLGDNAYDIGTDLEYQAAVFDMYPTFLRQTVLWPTLGNHDAASARSSTQSGVYYDVFSLPRGGEAGGLPSGTEAYYSFDRGHVHFVCLDSQDSSRSATGAMLTWLRADLASTSARWLVAFFHHPPYSKGSHDTDIPNESGGRSRDMRAIALPVLEAAGVDLVLTGHSHCYERSFLLNGHYDVSTTLTPAMILDRGNGDPAVDGSYAKPGTGPVGNQGAVYVVAGSAGQFGGGLLGHPAMYVGMHMLGSLIVDVDGDRLDGTFLTVFGNVADRFSIVKGPSRTLVRDEPTVSVAQGGTQHLHLRAGAGQAGRGYLLAGAFGTEPGFTLGGVAIPLNRDPWFGISVRLANSPSYPNSLGTLDAGGNADCAVVLPPLQDPGLVGVLLNHAFVVFDAQGVLHLASNPVRLRLSP